MVQVREEILRANTPLEIAKWMIQRWFQTDGGRPRLIEHRRKLWEWESDRWVLRDWKWLEDLCWNGLDGVFYEATVRRQGEDVMERRPIVPGVRLVTEVVRAIRSRIDLGKDPLPMI